MFLTVLTYVVIGLLAALAIFYLKNGADKTFVQEKILDAYYPEWSGRTYWDIHDAYTFNSTCPGTIGPAIISFLESKDYVDCIRLAIFLGGDADTIGAVYGQIAGAFYGFDAIPERWLRAIKDREKIDALIERFLSVCVKN